MFNLFVGVGIIGVAMGIGSQRPYDWLATPMHRQMQKSGNALLSFNYGPAIHGFNQNVTDRSKHFTSETMRKKALSLNGTNSGNASTRASAVNDVTNLNRRWGSNNIGISYPYTQQ